MRTSNSSVSVFMISRPAVLELLHAYRRARCAVTGSPQGSERASKCIKIAVFELMMEFCPKLLGLLWMC
jgi:hypothetical protein